MLTRDQILNAQDIEFDEVDVPEWAGTVKIRTFNGKDRDWFEQRHISKDGETIGSHLINARVDAVVLSACDEAGNLIFERKDIEVLNKRAAPRCTGYLVR